MVGLMLYFCVVVAVDSTFCFFQREPYSGSNFLYSESSSDDEEPLFQLSKVELCAKIKSLKRKLTDTMRENCRLRQSLVMLQGKVRGNFLMKRKAWRSWKAWFIGGYLDGNYGCSSSWHDQGLPLSPQSLIHSNIQFQQHLEKTALCGGHAIIELKMEKCNSCQLLPREPFCVPCIAII